MISSIFLNFYLLTSQVAVMSPIASIIKIKKTARKGSTIGPDTVNLNVLTQMKVAAGAAVMGLSSKYPQAAEMIIPTIRPSTTAHDFINGLPKRSIIMIEIHTLNPSPMNSGRPPRKSMLPGVTWTKHKISGRGTAETISATTSPIFETAVNKRMNGKIPSTDEIDSDKQDDRTSDEWREGFFQSFWRHETQPDFEECANTRCAKYCSITLRTRQTCT